jgi:hydroxypyruvate isomerase
MNRREALAVGAGVAGLAACADTTKSESNPGEKEVLLSGYALNVESWYADIPFEQRFDKAARDGFSSVEFWFIDSWKRKASDLAKLSKDAGVSVVQIVGDSPPLALTQSRSDFVENCKRAAENARILDCDIVTLTGHQNVEGVSKADSLKAYQDHMAAVAPIFEDAKVFAAIEPFNPYDHPGHFIYGSADAVKIVRAIDSPFMKINWDLFHMQRHEGELIGNLKRHADTICYVQLADAPNRGQPGTGDVNYANVIKQVRAGGYTRPIGLEFWAKDKNYDQAVQDMIDLSRAVDFT